MTCSCPSCGRRFVVVKAASEEARCVCGAALAATDLQKGIYEIKRSRRATRRRPLRANKAPTRPAAPIPVEADQGYGESHGYGPAHGGPSGPGDAPAPATTEIAPAIEEQPSKRVAPDAS